MVIKMQTINLSIARLLLCCIAELKFKEYPNRKWLNPSVVNEQIKNYVYNIMTDNMIMVIITALDNGAEIRVSFNLENENLIEIGTQLNLREQNNV